ncbi:MAG: ATP-binding protein [Syntrophales bacterium]|nr:ATP-binding protein [Syntrophales bacterium]
MKQTTFRIRRRIILAFLFCVLGVLIFAGLSFQAHREMGRRLRLVEQADDLVNNILEIRRFEKNFFLYKKPDSLKEARAYLQRVDQICGRTDTGILEFKTGPQQAQFQKTLQSYRQTFIQIERLLHDKSSGLTSPTFSRLEESLRNLGQELMSTAERWAKAERLAIDHLFLRAMYLFVASMVVFVILGFLVAVYIARLLVRPLFQMQTYMEKIAHGDFTPIPESECSSEEFFSLFRAFNRMIQELEHHQEQLVQSGKIAAIGTLTSGVAHELNNPINNIMLTAEALKEDFAQLGQEEALEMIHDILVQSGRASEIVKNLLDFSRSEQPEFEEVSIGEVIKDTLKLVQNQLVLSGIEVKRHLKARLPHILGNVKTLQQVFLNLFINAIQAMKDGGTLSIRGSLSEDRQWLKVEVTDTGAGIAPEDLPHIFEPFYTTKEVGRGTGLGLSVSFSIVQKHGGHLEVKSQLGRGSTFTLLLPVLAAEEIIPAGDRGAYASRSGG